MLRSLALPLSLMLAVGCASTDSQDAASTGAARPTALPAEPIVVLDDLETARVRAKQEGLPLLVSFTAHTCVNCRQMEVTVFEQPEVRALRAGYVEARLRVDATDAAARTKIATHVEEIARTRAQPVYVVLDPETRAEIGRFNGASLSDATPFAEFLMALGTGG